MFAIFEFGGKQYKVQKGDTLKVEKIEGDTKEIFFDKILLISEQNKETIIGTPFVKGFFVHAKVVETIKDKKVLIFKKKRRHNYRRKIGHRQMLTVVKVLEISNKKSIKDNQSNSQNIELEDKKNKKKL